MTINDFLLDAALAGFNSLSRLYKARSLEALAYSAGEVLAGHRLTVPKSCVSNGNGLVLCTEIARYNVTFGTTEVPFIQFDRAIF